jgi:hypothetical protein
MARTLLPIWKIYKQTLGLDVKEPADTFDWITGNTRDDYNRMRDVVNATGGREWLMAYDGVEKLNRIPIADTILSSCGNHHSGSSACSILMCYKWALEDWDSTVAKWKEAQAKEDYDNKQLSREEVCHYNNSKWPHSTFNHKQILADICESAGLTADLARPMMEARMLELEDECRVAVAADEKRRFDERIDVLEHHYNFPARWNDKKHGSALFGSPRSITDEMMVVMEARYPGYKKHIDSIIHVNCL